MLRGWEHMNPIECFVSVEVSKRALPGIGPHCMSNDGRKSVERCELEKKLETAMLPLCAYISRLRRATSRGQILMNHGIVK
jgi:hypothetical protein